MMQFLFIILGGSERLTSDFDQTPGFCKVEIGSRRIEYRVLSVSLKRMIRRLDELLCRQIFVNGVTEVHLCRNRDTGVVGLEVSIGNCSLGHSLRHTIATVVANAGSNPGEE